MISVAWVLCSSDNRGGMKRRDKEIRKQPSGDPSSGGNPALQQNPGISTTTGITARLFPYLLIPSFHSQEHSRGAPKTRRGLICRPTPHHLNYPPRTCQNKGKQYEHTDSTRNNNIIMKEKAYFLVCTRKQDKDKLPAHQI